MRTLELDPVEGGSANDYDYVNADPCNNYDLDGKRACPKWLKTGVGVAGMGWISRAAYYGGMRDWNRMWGQILPGFVYNNVTGGITGGLWAGSRAVVGTGARLLVRGAGTFLFYVGIGATAVDAFCSGLEYWTRPRPRSTRNGAN